MHQRVAAKHALRTLAATLGAALVLATPTAASATVETRACPDGYKGVIIGVNGNEVIVCVKPPPKEVQEGP